MNYDQAVDEVAVKYHNYWHGHDPLEDCESNVCRRIIAGPKPEELVRMLHAGGFSQIAYILEAKIQVAAMSEISESEHRVLDGNR